MPAFYSLLTEIMQYTQMLNTRQQKFVRSIFDYHDSHY